MAQDDTAVKIRSGGTSTPPAPSLEGLYSRPGFKIRRAHQIAVAIFAEATGALNITTSQYGVLHTLAKVEGLDQITLARLVGLDRSTTSLVLGLLEQRGIVERVQNKADRRRRVLHITESGRQLFEQAQAPVAHAVSRLMEVLPPQDHERFLDVLERIVAAAVPAPQPAMSSILHDLYRRPGFLIRRAHQMSSALFVECCKPQDVTPTQFGMMFVLRQRPQLDQATLARLAYFDRSTGSMVADMLENRGWIERRVDPLDRRRRLLALTPLGNRILDEIMPGSQKARETFLAELDEEEKSFLLSCLDTIITTLQRLDG